MKVTKALTRGVQDAGGIIVGKAAARAIPAQFGLPRGGALGLAVQAAVGVVAGMAADKFVGREFGRMVLAGALTAPIETVVVSANVPILAPALSPVTSAAAVGAYAGTSAVRGDPALSAYAQPRLAGYVEPAEEDYEPALW